MMMTMMIVMMMIMMMIMTTASGRRGQEKTLVSADSKERLAREGYLMERVNDFSFEI